MPFEVGVDVEVGLALHQLGLERAPHRDHAEHARPRREDPLAPALDHELLEELRKFLVQEPHAGFVPAHQERAQPVLLLALAPYASDHELPSRGVEANQAPWNQALE